MYMYSSKITNLFPCCHLMMERGGQVVFGSQSQRFLIIQALIYGDQSGPKERILILLH